MDIGIWLSIVSIVITILSVLVCLLIAWCQNVKARKDKDSFTNGLLAVDALNRRGDPTIGEPVRDEQGNFTGGRYKLAQCFGSIRLGTSANGTKDGPGE